MNYKHKYQKYKLKYIELKHKIGGNREAVESSEEVALEKSDIKNKMLGVLYGNCIGDALGTRYEFSSKEKATNKVTQDIQNNFLPMLGGGPFKTEPGQISDDAEMTISLLTSIVNNSSYDQDDVAQQYIKWFNTNPVDIGNTIKRSLRTRNLSQNSAEMIKNSKELNISSLSNGVLMRVSPLGVYAAHSKISSSELKDLVDQECDLTHPNPIIKDAVFIYCMAIKYAILGIDKESIYKKLLKKVTEPRVKIVLKDSRDNLYPSYLIDDKIKEIYVCPDSKKYQGYFGIAFQMAFYELFNSKDFESALVNIIKMGGDTDTNAAISGALLGAYYGLDSINKNWVSSVKNQNISRVKDYPDMSPAVIDSLVDKLLE